MMGCSFLVTGKIKVNIYNYKDLKIENQSQQKSHAGAPLKVHKRENFLGFDFEICTFS